MCHVNPFISQDQNVTFDKDANGAWMNGCSKCVHAVEKGMGVEWDVGLAQIQNRTNNDKDAKFAQQVDQCVANYEALPESAFSPFPLPSSVIASSVMGTQSFYDLLFLSDSQVIKYTGASIKAMGLTLSRRLDEQGQVIEGVYISTADLPEMGIGEFFSLRRVRVFSASTTDVSEHLLETKMQIRQDQGPELAALVERRKNKDDALKPSHYMYVNTFPKLREKADKVNAAKEQKAKDSFFKIGKLFGWVLYVYKGCKSLKLQCT